MATNHTEQYKLNLWEPQDAFVRAEFNENTEKLEAALCELAQTKAEGTETDALRTEVGDLRAAKATVVTGAYTGSGQCGATHPNRLDFAGLLDGPPKLIIIRPDDGQGHGYVLLYGMANTLYDLSGRTQTGEMNRITWTQTGLSWYSGSTLFQFNNSGAVYRYIAIG